ncbi:RagB/SusD family nutrient uptake outer membrane protein [Capnocytophaga bilenii]|jgi:ragB/susD domain protein
MKKIIKKYLYLTIAFPLLNSCADLDQQPFNTLGGDTPFKTVEDAKNWATGIYPKLIKNHFGPKMYLTDLQSDFLNMKISSLLSGRDFHTWDFTNGEASIKSAWADSYTAIQNMNYALQGFANFGNKEAIKEYMGQYYLTRAYYNTYLVTHFCKAYNEATADTDLGLSIFDYQVKDFPDRSSLRATYDYILSDISKAKTLLAGKTGTVGAREFTVDAAKALDARVRLYKGDWQGAYSSAKGLIDGGKYPLVTDAATLQKVWENDQTNESITQLAVSLSTGERPETNEIYIAKNADAISMIDGVRTWTTVPGSTRTRSVVLNVGMATYLPTQSFIDLFDSNDIRKQAYLLRDYVTVAGTGSAYTLYMVGKYRDNVNLKIRPEASPTYLHEPKIFRIAEQYLIAAEAAYKNNDVTNAQKYLNLLRRARGLSNVTATGSALFTEIQNERNRELCFEGFRQHDLKRWQQGVVRGTPQRREVIVTDPADKYYQLNKPYTDYKMVWPVPNANILIRDGKYKQNPGW